MKTPTSSKYPVLDNKPIDQLKVTELKEELKKRRLKTGGLKDELIRRLDEALRAEMEDTNVEGDSDNGIAVEGDGGNAVAVEETAPEIVVADAPGNLSEHPVVDAGVLGFESSGITEETMAKVEETVGDAEEPMVKAEEAVGNAKEPVVKAEEVLGYAEEPVVTAEEIVGNDEGAVGYVEKNVSKEDANAVPLETDKVIGEELSKNGTYEEQQSGLGNAPVYGEGIVSEAYTASGIVGGDVSEVQQLGLADDPPLGDAMVVGEVTEGLDGLIDSKMGSDIGDSGKQDDSENIMPAHEDMKLDSSDQTNQVSEVSTSLGFTVKSNNSVSTDSVSIIEKNDLKDNLIADNVNLETDVKPEMVLPSSSDLVPDGGESHPGDVDEPLENMVSVGETDNSVANADVSQKNYSADLGSEKLNLDRSSGDDSMEEDALESKQIDSNFNSEVVGEKTEKIDDTAIKVDNPVATAMDTDLPAESKVIHDQKSDVANLSDKRKLTDEEAVVNNKPAKRQHRWKKESNITEPQYSDILPPVSAKDVPQTAVLRRSFSRSDSIGANDHPKEREVPPSAKPATNSLRIDNFLRPFTLKAAQELLGKSGTVSSFWMDHIKTHCYVTYSSIEEAEATRNAVYNLQWPPNGGRQLVAEFVDPEEVKLRLEPPPPTTAPPATSASTKGPEVPTGPLPSPRQQNLRQQTTLPPPPPLPNQIPARERVAPPPPPIEKVDAPIVTLDDLFRKTKATPRIYYLPLSDEQVAAKRKNLKQ